MNERKILSVTQLNDYIKMLLDGQPVLHNVCVCGEISNFVNHRTGHWYFSLKDEGSLIRCVMFRGSNINVRFLPQNGTRVILYGQVTSYVRDGQYQIYAKNMQPDGIGALYVAFEQLKARLEAEGLFDSAKKKPIPRFPERIGIITSPTGAAIRDMINITGRRFPGTELVIYPSMVQGSEAPLQLVGGLEYFNRSAAVDLIIIGRGGGSFEDLSAFNDERTARAVAASDIPVISAVGHETDFTICDFVADLRAPTPSAAAELALPDEAELRAFLDGVAGRLRMLVLNRLKSARVTVKHLAESRVLTEPLSLLDDRRVLSDNLSQRLDRGISDLLGAERNRLANTAARLAALDPLSVLTRGYGAVEDPNGRIISSVTGLSEGQKIKIRFSDGTADAQVKKITADSRGTGRAETADE